MKYKELLIPYNPWWDNPDKAFERLPLFHRPIYDEIFKGLKEIPQIISITGPRRVGKSTKSGRRVARDEKYIAAAISNISTAVDILG